MEFQEFIHLHYSTHHTLDADHEKDMQLPFKCPDLHLISHISPVVDQMDFLELKPNPLVFEMLFQNHDKDHVNPYLTSIFQPPRQS